MKRGQKRQLLTQLYQQGYDPKTAKDWLTSQECIDKYGNTISIGKGYRYQIWREIKQGKLTPEKESSESKEPMKKAPLKIEVTGEPTPPEQLKIIRAGEGITPTAQGMLTGEQMSGFWKSISYNYPEKHRWDDGANKFLGAIWAPLFNKWVSASSENFLLGFAIICTIIIVLKPTILSVRDWQASKKKKEGGKSRKEKLKEQEKEVLKTN